MSKWIVQEQATLLEAVAKLAPDSSKTTHRSWIREGRVFVDGKASFDPRTALSQNQVVTLTPKSKFVEDTAVQILYEDKHLVVVNKPAGLLTVAAAFQKEHTLHAYLKNRYRPDAVYPVHRLDQETSGTILFARTAKARDYFKEQFERHAIDRLYTAVVEGQLTPPAGTWHTYQYEDPQYYVHNTLDPRQGKLAITHYRTQETSRHFSLLELKLETGRKNQIRAHCLFARHPVVGDKKYGAHSDPAKRVCLHARHLGFEHPISKAKMSFDSPLPDVFLRLVQHQD